MPNQPIKEDSMSSCKRTGAAVIVTILALLVSGPLSAAELGRVICKVMDIDDNPIKGATVTVTTEEKESFLLSRETNRKGRCTINLTDATFQYDFKVEAEGFQAITVKVKPQVSGITERVFKLAPVGIGEAGGMELNQEDRDNMALGSKALRTYNEGVDAQNADDLDTAMAKFKEAAELDPEMEPAFTQIAAVAILQGDFAAAAEAADKAVSLDSESFRALHVRYEAYRKLGDEEKADEAADALRKAGDVHDAAARIYNDAVDAYNAGNIEAAKATFREAIELDPELLAAYKTLAGLYIKERNGREAASMARQVLEREPDNVNAMKILYDASSITKDDAGVQEALEMLVVADPEWAASGLFEHARKLYDEGNTDGALAVVTELLKVQPDHAGAHYILGLCLNIGGDVDGTKEHLQRFLELAPDHPEAPIAKEILSYYQK
jgi:tetratricopeptide (TPR) repeat protein